MDRLRRQGRPKLGWKFALTAGCAGVIVLACALNSLRWINRPFPGFFLWENLFVPAVGDTDWSGYEAGLPYQSRLIAVNGHEVSSADQVYRVAAGVPAGTGVTYTFAVEPAAPPVTLTIPTMRFTWHEYLWTLGNYLAVGVLLTLLGLAVYVLRPDAPGAYAMLIAGVTWGLHFVTAADIFGPAWFRPLCLVLQAIGPVTLLHLALTFPVERALLTRHPRLLPALYVIALCIGLANNLIFFRWFAGVVAINRLFVVAVMLGGLTLIGLLAYSFFVPPSAAVRQRLKIAALGGAAAFSAPVVGVFLYLMGVRFPLNLVTLLTGLFPLAIGYAIVKHDLFEVDAIIRRTVAWAIFTGLIAALYLGAVGTLELLFTGRSGRIVQLMFLLVIAALFNPLRNRVQAAVDFFFARDRYDYRKTVTEVSQALATLLDLETVVTRILHTITDTVHVDFGAVWLRREGDGYELQAVGGIRQAAGLPRRLDSGNALVHQLEQRPQDIVSEDSVARRNGHGARELSRLGATLLVPMTFERRLAGFLALGAKQSGKFYSREYLELLRTLANQGAVAVENAQSYRALLHANEELRAAQTRLIEAERLAAIGELSAAVAHGIRNPVAGIKAAAQFAKMDLPSDHPLHENIADIIGEADKLEARIRTLLDFAKPFEPRLVPCRIDSIVGDAVGSLRTQMSAQRVALITDVDPALPTIALDYAQIEQVLLALLSNAVEAMPDGGQLTVTARSSADAAHARIEVADNGPGIPADQQARVFKLFFTTKSSGTGFGLAVAKKIVERHGGTITLESAPGQGTRFIIELPLAASVASHSEKGNPTTDTGLN